MDKSWVESSIQNAKKKFDEEKLRIKEVIKKCGKFHPEEADDFIKRIDSLQYDDEMIILKLTNLEIDFRYGILSADGDIREHINWFEDQLMYHKLKSCFTDYNRYLDSEPIEFDGDIIITDPCYVIKEQEPNSEDNDWELCEYGYNMEALGFKNYITRDTLYGDWSCTTFNSDTGEEIGGFCADAGMVSVFDLAEVLNYNPEFDFHINRKWTTTLVKDFKGTVQIVINRISGTYDEDTSYHKKGDKWEDFAVKVIGHGVNKVTGEKINFVGRQTGL